MNSEKRSDCKTLTTKNKKRRKPIPDAGKYFVENTTIRQSKWKEKLSKCNPEWIWNQDAKKREKFETSKKSNSWTTHLKINSILKKLTLAINARNNGMGATVQQNQTSEN